MIIIPIGIDCGLAGLLNKYNLRQHSFPFDWIVTYGGVSKIFQNDFNLFLPTDCANNVNKIYDLCFIHNTFPEDYIKMNRRIDRLQKLLNDSNELIFFRKGHAFHNHEECDKGGLHISNDITDSEELNILLKNKYPNLNYKIIIVLVCDTCFNPTKTYNSKSSNIFIYNISTKGYDNSKFEILFNEIILKKFV